MTVSSWRMFAHTLAKNPISAFAVLCVAATASFLGYMTLRMSGVLESSAWCGKAIQAEKISPGSSYVGLTTCVDLLKIQLQAIALGFHISVSAFAFSLVVLIVIVIAGARASGKMIGGIEFDVSRQDPVARAADQVANAAADEAGQIKGDAP